MKLAIMQPYFFPYIGYFQLIDAVDKFVFYDDVNFIKSGWINRNRLFIAGSIRYITVPLNGASSFNLINKTSLRPTNEWVKNILSAVALNYCKAPFYKNVIEMLEYVLTSHNGNLATLAINSITFTSKYLGLSTEFVKSSSKYNNQEKKGVERVIDICLTEKASEYWNLPGGRNLYSTEVFEQNGIDLKFVDVYFQTYQQITAEFHAGLSVLDVLMFNEPGQILTMLRRHESKVKSNAA